FRAHALVTAVTSWVYPLLAAVIWAGFGMTVARGALLWATTQGMRALLAISLSIRREGLARPSLRLLQESISFGLRAWVGTLADSLGFRVDQILLALIASEASLGFYVVAVNLSEILLYFPGAVSTALLPLAARPGSCPDPALRSVGRLCSREWGLRRRRPHCPPDLPGAGPVPGARASRPPTRRLRGAAGARACSARPRRFRTPRRPLTCGESTEELTP